MRAGAGPSRRLPRQPRLVRGRGAAPRRRKAQPGPSPIWQSGAGTDTAMTSVSRAWPMATQASD